MGFAISKRVLACWFGSSGWLQATQVMSNPLGRACAKCVWISAPAIGSIQQGSELVILLAGGQKRGQAADIRLALELARNL